MPCVSINPGRKVGELLEAYPWLEETLVGFAPEFAKLKNPILRKTVARVATLLRLPHAAGRVRTNVNSTFAFFCSPATSRTG